MRLETDRDRHGIVRMRMYLARIGRNSSQRPKGLVACAGLFVVEPGFRKSTRRLVHNHLRLARSPKPQPRRLHRFGVSPFYVNYQRILRVIDVRGRLHAAATLHKLSVVKVQASLIVCSRSQLLQPLEHNLSRRKAHRPRIGSIQLHGQAIFRPNCNAQPTVAQGHGFARF